MQSLPPEKQQAVLDLIELLQTDEWNQVYKGRFQELREVVQMGVEAADRGEVVDAEEAFRQLQERLQQL